MRALARVCVCVVCFGLGVLRLCAVPFGWCACAFVCVVCGVVCVCCMFVLLLLLLLLCVWFGLALLWVGWFSVVGCVGVHVCGCVCLRGWFGWACPRVWCCLCVCVCLFGGVRL